MSNSYSMDYTFHGILKARILEWVAIPFPSPGDLPNPRIELRSPALQADSLPAEPRGKHETGKSRANRVGLGGSENGVRAFSMHLLALLSPALAALLFRLFFHSGKTLNLLSGKEKEDALLDATANIPGLLLIMSHAHPWTHHWGREGE